MWGCAERPPAWLGASLVHPLLGGVFGGVLLSHTLTSAVPSALQGLASGFGMGPGVSLAQWPPKQSGVVIPHRWVWGIILTCLLIGISYSGRERYIVFVWSRHLFGVVTSPRPISTSQLHTLLCFHVWPINPMVCRGPYPLKVVRVLILKHASRLDAFSGYHFPT